ncbi:hypothetical protein NDU88_002387 [Pleurodeles waltl]|uniref:Uncharacterized protein n=1 Tax=Pleurodeles waltl TaxID=8319 RepID=A0AAV7UWW1_PLEWA|nr:hypothetical protein NDU88_002387 [Pleurodeles waltl]
MKDFFRQKRTGKTNIPEMLPNWIERGKAAERDVEQEEEKGRNADASRVRKKGKVKRSSTIAKQETATERNADLDIAVQEEEEKINSEELDEEREREADTTKQGRQPRSGLRLKVDAARDAISTCHSSGELWLWRRPREAGATL